MHQLMNPLLWTVGLLGLIAFLQFGLYIGLRREVSEFRKSYEERIKARRESKESLRSEMLKLSEELVDLNPPTAPASSIGQSINLSRRNQVLRMYLRGDSPSRIAAALKISRSEVDLLVKVHRAVMPPAASPATDSSPVRRRAVEVPAASGEEMREVGALPHAK